MLRADANRSRRAAPCPCRPGRGTGSLLRSHVGARQPRRRHRPGAPAARRKGPARAAVDHVGDDARDRRHEPARAQPDAADPRPCIGPHGRGDRPARRALRRGGTSTETGFDCSGFTRHVFETSPGLVLPRRADEQATAAGLVAVKREDLRPGDLVFFNTLKRTFSHVGIYIGDNRFIHSPRPGKNVRTEDMGFAYWAKRFTGARRVDTTAAVEPALAAPLPSSAGGD